MKKLIAVSAMLCGLSVIALADEWTGYVVDEKCSTNPAMKTNKDCIETCIKGGSPAVLVTDDGKVYKIVDQKKVTPHAGQKVSITGKMQNGEIQVSKVAESK